MEDLDLDELDQAVGKIMSKNRGRKPVSRKPLRADSSPSVVVPQRPQPDQQSQSSQPEPNQEQEQPSDQQSQENRPKIASRRRVYPGAMDIIRPENVVQSVAPSKQPGRVAAALQPIKQQPFTPQLTEQAKSPKEVGDELIASLKFNDIIPSKPKPKPQPEIPEPEEAKPEPVEQIKAEEPEIILPPQPVKNNWPDPLDYLDFDNPQPKKAEPPTEEREPQKPEIAPAEATPFIATKVEKRPLGAYNSVVPEAPKIPEASEEPPKADMAEASMESRHHLEQPEEPEILQQMSIPGQKTDELQQPEEKIRGMYDTKEYHAAPQPIYGSHRGNPWLVVIVVALITLVVGVALVGYLMATGMF